MLESHMPEFKSYSTRNFKTDHLRRLKRLKPKLRKSVEDILVQAVETGLQKLEATTETTEGKRFVPFGIKENMDYE